MGKAVAAGRRGAANGKELRAMVTQGVADVVEPDRMGKLRVKQAHDVAPSRECPALFVDSVLGGQIANHSHRDELAKLIEDDVTVLGWFWLFHNSVSLVGNHPKPTTFSNLLFMAMGWL